MSKALPVQGEPALRIHQSIARDIGTDIVSGRRKPGDMMEGEIEAAEQLGVSRTTYREAIRILVAKGLIESRPKAGTRVTQRNRWNLLDPELLAWTFSGEPDPAFVRDLFELRGIIEPAAAEFAAVRATDAQRADIADALALMHRHSLTTAEGRAADQYFHRAILSAARNEALATLAGSVIAAVEWTTGFKQRKGLLPQDSVLAHQAVYDAIEARDASGARLAMVALVELAFVDMGLASSPKPSP